MDKNINNILKRLEQDQGVAILSDGKLARKFGKQPKIRALRKNNQIYIAKDRKKNVTVIIRMFNKV